MSALLSVHRFSSFLHNTSTMILKCLFPDKGNNLPCLVPTTTFTTTATHQLWEKIVQVFSRPMRVARLALVVSAFLGVSFSAQAQSTNETIPAGSFIIDMGVVPQTFNNGLKPYGMIYDLLKNYQVPIKWVINDAKVKDGTDFTYNNRQYKGGPFIVPAQFRNAAVNARITFWQGQGVQGTTTTAPITVPVFTTLNFAPNWTLDFQNGALVTDFFENAGIPPSAHGGSSQSGWKQPSQLGPCDDIFAMAHADPEWDTHQRLLDWNAADLGSIWYGCHAGSALENMFNPANRTQQTNFLADKLATATGNGPYANNQDGQGRKGNTLILWGDHGKIAKASAIQQQLAYDYPTDPIMQFMGGVGSATRNGSEDVYLPKLAAGWRTTTRPGIYAPNFNERESDQLKHRAAITAWGRGFGDPNRGWVLMQAAHDIDGDGSQADKTAAQRIFFNLGFRALIGKVVLPSVDQISENTTIAPGEPIDLSVTVAPPAMISDFTYQWTSSCGGTFSPSSTVANPTFTPPVGAGSYTCVVTVIITDPCNRTSFSATPVNVACDLQVSTTLTQPCVGTNGGAIAMTVTGGTGVTYTWTRAGGGSGMGSGTTISGLSAGTYTVNITTSNGCMLTFNRTLVQSPAINLTVTPTPVACFGQSTGSISLSVAGGTPGFTYAWNDGSTTRNRSSLPAGTYTVTVTDANGCTANTSATITQPGAPLSVTRTKTDVNCFGDMSGTITLNVAGGTPAYTFLWNDGATTQNRTGLSGGTYSVTVTDANNCTVSSTGIMITEPATPLSLSSTQVNDDCGMNAGSVTVMATGGTAPYTYDWSGTPNGDGTATITDLAGGTYAVTVTDANGCTAVLSTTVTQASPLTLSVAIVNPPCPPNAAPPLNGDGEIDLTVTGGTIPYTYAWTTSDGSGLNPTAQDQTNLTAGTYSVMVTDVNGCTASTSVTLENENELPVIPIGINNN